MRIFVLSRNRLRLKRCARKRSRLAGTTETGLVIRHSFVGELPAAIRTKCRRPPSNPSNGTLGARSGDGAIRPDSGGERPRVMRPVSAGAVFGLFVSASGLHVTEPKMQLERRFGT